MAEPTWPWESSEPAQPWGTEDSDLFWETYLNASKEEDKYLPDSWEANTGSLLTFTGLFAATVAAFIIESYKSLSPDSGEQTVILLSQLLAVATNGSSGSSVNLVQDEQFHASTTAILVNAFWFSSLIISLICALLSTLIQEWSRDYKRGVDRRRTLDESVRDRAFNHIYIRFGVDRYRMDRVVYSTTVLIHTAVILFAVGLVIFLFPINHTVAGIAASILVISALVYVSGSTIPLIDTSCLYRTPMTSLVASVYWLMLGLRNLASKRVKTAHQFADSVSSQTIHDYDKFLRGDRLIIAWDRTRHHLLADLPRLMKCVNALIDELSHHDMFFEEQEFLIHLCMDSMFTKRLNFYLGHDLLNMIDSKVLIHYVSELSKFILHNFIYSAPQLQSHTAEHAFFDLLKHLIEATDIGGGHTHTSSRSTAHLCLSKIRMEIRRLCTNSYVAPIPTSHTRDRWRFLSHSSRSLIYQRDKLSTKNPGDWDREDRHPVSLLFFIWDLNQSYGEYREFPLPKVHRPHHFRRPNPNIMMPIHSTLCCTHHSIQPWSLHHDKAQLIFTVAASIMQLGPEEEDIVDTSGVNNLCEIEDFGDGNYEKYPPSEHFISVLITAGLSNWLQPGNPRVEHEIVNIPLWHEWCIKALSYVAENVIDWEKYHRGQSGGVPTHLEPASHLHAAAPGESQSELAIQRQNSTSPDQHALDLIGNDNTIHTSRQLSRSVDTQHSQEITTATVVGEAAASHEGDTLIQDSRLALPAELTVNGSNALKEDVLSRIFANTTASMDCHRTSSSADGPTSRSEEAGPDLQTVKVIHDRSGTVDEGRLVDIHAFGVSLGDHVDDRETRDTAGAQEPAAITIASEQFADMQICR